MIAIKSADVIHPQKAALEDVLAQSVLSVDPPGEVQKHLLKDTLHERVVRYPGALALDIEDCLRSQRQDRRIDIVEVPLVSGDLSIGVHVPLAQHQQDLLLGKLRIDMRKRNAVKPEVPGSEPRKLPLVGHRDHVAREEMCPLVVASL